MAEEKIYSKSEAEQQVKTAVYDATHPLRCAISKLEVEESRLLGVIQAQSKTIESLSTAVANLSKGGH